MLTIYKFFILVFVSNLLSVSGCKPRKSSDLRTVGVEKSAKDGGGFDLIYQSDDGFVHRIRCPEAKLAGCDEKHPMNVKMPLDSYRQKLADTLGLSDVNIDKTVIFLDDLEERFRTRYMEILTSQESTAREGWGQAQKNFIVNFKKSTNRYPQKFFAMIQKIEATGFGQLQNENVSAVMQEIMDLIAESQLELDALGRSGISAPRVYTEILQNLPKNDDKVGLIAGGESRGRKKGIFQFALIPLDNQSTFEIADQARRKAQAERPFRCSAQCNRVTYRKISGKFPTRESTATATIVLDSKGDFPTTDDAMAEGVRFCNGTTLFNQIVYRNGEMFDVMEMQSLLCKKYDAVTDQFPPIKPISHPGFPPDKERPFATPTPLLIKEGGYWTLDGQPSRIKDVTEIDKTSYSMTRKWNSSGGRVTESGQSGQLNIEAKFTCKVLGGETVCSSDAHSPITITNSITYLCNTNPACKPDYSPSKPNGQSVLILHPGQHYHLDGRRWFMYDFSTSSGIWYGETLYSEGKNRWLPADQAKK